MGLAPTDSVLEGNAIQNFEQFTADHRDNAPMMSLIDSFQMHLFARLAEYEKGAAMFASRGFDFPKANPAHPGFMDAVCSGGICAFAMTRRRKSKYRKCALKARSLVKTWLKKGNPNVKHFDALFDAEAAALQGKQKKAEDFYRSAIAVASRGGYTHDSALANERYGDYLLTVLCDREEARYYLSAAAKLYMEWGAVAKVDRMQAQYSEFDLLS